MAVMAATVAIAAVAVMAATGDVRRRQRGGEQRLDKLAMRSNPQAQPDNARIPATLLQAGAPRFWLAALGTGIGAGVSAAILTRFLEIVQHFAWAGSGTHILDAAAHAGAWRHILVLLGAGIVVGIGQLVLSQL